MIFICLLAGLLVSLNACTSESEQAPDEADLIQKTDDPEHPLIPGVQVIDREMEKIVKANATIEVLSSGHTWTEGPVWVEQDQLLLFSDIPPNKIFQWREHDGPSLYLSPSGYTGETERGGEVGSNGLLLDRQDNLVLCQHGDRRIARMEASISTPVPDYVSLADRWEGKRFNSPNDAVFHSNGDLYFTDPPYGLEKMMDDPAKEIPFQGVYRLDAQGTVHLLTDELSRPNGIAFSPDEKTLYVANSDPKQALWMAYDVLPDGSISKGRVFFDATSMVPDRKGLPDGLKVDENGTLFATGPGGVLVFTPEGRHLGTIDTGQATSNCAIDPQRRILYMTADDYLMRVSLN